MFTGKAIKNYRSNQDGQFGILAAISLLALVMAVGSGIDATRHVHAKEKSQSIADSIALAAAVYVDLNGAPPGEDDIGFRHNQTYSASELGYELYGATNATFKVLYDDENKEVEVIFNGDIPTTFMRVANIEDMAFAASTTAKYRETEFNDPASVMFVLDNSGSMWFDDKPIEVGASSAPADAVIRMDALKGSLTKFNSYLDAIQNDNDETQFVRTGMMPYNEELLTQKMVNFQWGALPDSAINSMSPWGATNSSPPMTEAWNQMQDEPAVHMAESGASPLRYVIFMTDGNNTVGENIWVPEEGTNHWRREIEKEQCRWRRRRGWVCWNYSDFEYFPEDGPSDEDIIAPAGAEWEEGKFYLSSDIETMQICEQMKAAGVEVYSIGFALEAGTYATNYWGQVYNQPYRNVDTDTKNSSIELLSACASDGDNFILAENAEELEKVFDKIGNDILLDTIRIKK